jgi:peptidoglycan/LPS O-acetylase OafA/YrhL
MSAIDAPPVTTLPVEDGVASSNGHADAGRPPSGQPQSGRAGARRLAWLDALRGFAALCVVFDHAGYRVLQGVRADVYQWFDPGQYGVFVFFLVSGYIVPASLERKGSLRGFWISRAFRLYPLYLLVVGLSVLGAANGVGTVYGAERHPLTSAAAWLLMMPDILAQGISVPNVTWTLSFEMVFYLVVAGLFSWNLHRRSGTIALGLAIGAVAFGGLMPISGLYYLASAHGQAGLRTLYLGADVLIGGGVIASAVASRAGGTVRLAGKIGATVAAVTALLLLFFNEFYPFSFSGFQILALMFTGTLIYRAEQGQTSKAGAAAISLAVLALTIAAGLWHGGHLGTAWGWQWVTSLGGAALTFAAGMAARRRGLPGWLAWLGLVSYSVYLLHPLVIVGYTYLARQVQADTGAQAFIAVGMVTVILVVSAISYYGLEKPMQKLGRRVSARWEA